MAKRLDSRYLLGKHAATWIKIKPRQDGGAWADEP